MANLIFRGTMWAKERFQPFARGRRMARMIRVLGLKGGERILDLGGTPPFWRSAPVPLDLTLLNLPGGPDWTLPEGPHRFTLLEGDACAVDLPDMSFDIVVSNSVIEHVGDGARQAAMAHEVRRLAPRYWVQTPSIWFPIEAHTNMPFWWFYPEPLKQRFLRDWRRRLPAWCEMVEGATVIRRSELQALFPDARIWTERLAGIAKSYVAYRV